MKALLIDFYDSFTNNVAASLLEIGIECEVVKYDGARKHILNLINENKKSLIVLGPGPGSPDEYKSLFDILEQSLSKSYIFHFGICLGHQLILKIKGAQVHSSNYPAHGKAEELLLPKWKGWFPANVWGKSIKAQRYNSLAVSIPKNAAMELWYAPSKELMGARGANFVTYQFHPESVGTSGHKFLFSPLSKVLYNNYDDKSDKDKRTL